MTRDLTFEEEVDRWITELVTGGPLDFADLLRALPGVDPNVTRARLHVAPEQTQARIRWRNVSDVGEPVDRRLPVPHPLDFDWRFTRATRTRLADEIAQQGTHAILLGAPTLWIALREARRVRPRSTYLIDRHDLAGSVRESAGYLRADLLRDDPPADRPRADIVMADPPWYPEATAHFLWVAASLLKLGGHVLLSVAPVGTRPGVLGERAHLVAEAGRCGLTLRETRSSALVYATPPFERNALRALDLLQFVPMDWRRGDLLVLEKTSDASAPRPALTEEPTEWVERTLRGVRLRVRRSPDVDHDPRLVPLIAGDIFPSVSRRDPRRASVGVWTAGNRVFGCASPSLLLRVLDDLEGTEPVPDVPDEWARETRATVKKVVQQELGEYICSGDDGMGDDAR